MKHVGTKSDPASIATQDDLGGGSPGGAGTAVQYRNGAAFGGASNLWVDSSGFPALGAITSDPATPEAGGLLYGRRVTDRIMPGFMGPRGLGTVVQPHISRNFVGWAQALGNGTAISAVGIALSATGTATAANVATTNPHTAAKRLGYHVTTAATTAVAGARGAAQQFFRGTAGSGMGGFHFMCRFGPSLASASSGTRRMFCGLRASTSAPTDVNPSGLTDIIGVGCDSTDTNFQLMTRGASGTATKIDTGMAKAATVATKVYEVGVFAPPGATSVYIELRDLVTGAAFGQEIATNLPTATTLLNLYCWISVGGVSSTIGLALMNMYIETDM